MWHDSILDAIGGTPLVRLRRVTTDTRCTLLGKAEFLNPGGSVKDRIGVAMVEAAERDGTLRPGGTIVEGTSGNTGAGLALVAIARGYRCVFTTTDKQSQEKIDLLRALGAEVVVCPTAVAPEDPRSYYSVARRLASEIPNAVHLNQYDNPSNTRAHYDGTGPEIWRDTGGRVTHFIATAGTGGTISGTARYLKERNPEVKVVGVDPFGSVYYRYFFTREFDSKEIYPYVTEGGGEDILAGNMDFGLVDDYVRVTDRDAMLMTRRLARQEGLFVGQSSGMAVEGAAQWLRSNAESIKPTDIVVVLLPDSGFRYLRKTYNDQWMRDHGFLEPRPELTARHVVAARGQDGVVAVSPELALGGAIALMHERGISQLPVVDDTGVVGSLSETDVLHALMADPAAREKSVRGAMGEPLPVVPASIDIERLSALIQGERGAVLVDTGSDTFTILTKSDLIGALAAAARDSREVVTNTESA